MSTIKISDDLLNSFYNQNPGLDSAQAIASLTKEQFVKMMPGDEATARQMHKKAVDIKAKIQLLWANMKDAIAFLDFQLT